MCSATHARSEFPDSSDFERGKVEVQKSDFSLMWKSGRHKMCGNPQARVTFLSSHSVLLVPPVDEKKRSADDSHGRGQSQKYRIRHAKRSIGTFGPEAGFHQKGVKKCIWTPWGATWPKVVQNAEFGERPERPKRGQMTTQSEIQRLRPTSTCKF